MTEDLFVALQRGATLVTANARLTRSMRQEFNAAQLAAGAASERLHVSYPRIELSESRARVPSFYALDVMRLLEERGAHVVYHDPHVPSFREDGHEMHGVPMTDELLASVDAVVVITDHKVVDYQTLTPSKARLVTLTSSRVLGGAH